MTERLEDHKIVHKNEWIESRKGLLKKYGMKRHIRACM